MRTNRYSEAMLSVTIPVEDDQHIRKQIFPLRQIRPIPIVVVAVAIGLVVFFVQGYRLSTAPDIFSDEGLYLLVGVNLAKGLGLEVNGSAFMWHAPGYMLIEAAYIKLVGLTNADPLTTLFSVRYLNIFFSAITAVLLFLISNRLHSKKAGLVTVALFLMDPYVQRINRRSMLETLAMLCILFGLYIFFTYQQRLTKRQRLGAGIAFGMAVLTKEPMFLELLTLMIYVLLFRRNQLRDAVWVTVIACLIYLVYPLWAIMTDQGHDYLVFKLLGLSRIVNLFAGHSSTSHTSTVTLVSSENVTFLSSILLRLTQYGTSYLLIALSALCMVFLVLRVRHRVAARYLISWGIFSFGFGLVLGSISDQNFYYLIVPSTLIVGYSLISLLEAVLHSPHKKALPIQQQQLISLPGSGQKGNNTETWDANEDTQVLPKITQTDHYLKTGQQGNNTAAWYANEDTQVLPKITQTNHYPKTHNLLSNFTFYRVVWKPIFALFIVMFLYNSYIWIVTYVVSSDDVYSNTIKYVETHIPRGKTIEVSDDVALYYLSPAYNIRLDRNTQAIIDMHAQYFIMSSKDALGEYDDMTPLLYNWVKSHSHPLLEGYDPSFWRIGIYRLTTE